MNPITPNQGVGLWQQLDQSMSQTHYDYSAFTLEHLREVYAAVYHRRKKTRRKERRQKMKVKVYGSAGYPLQSYSFMLFDVSGPVHVKDPTKTVNITPLPYVAGIDPINP